MAFFLIYCIGHSGDITIQENYKKILNVLKDRKDIHIVITKSPLAKGEEFSGDNITVVEKYPMIEYMPAFDCAISAAGYNTFHELLYAGVPTSFIPKKRGYDDQELMVIQAQEKNMCLHLDEDLIEEKLNSQINTLLEKGKELSINAKANVPINGAILAAEVLNSKIEQFQILSP